jgi:hypothetical protein
MYRGASSEALHEGSFPGTFLATDKETAGQYGEVRSYRVAAKNFLDIDHPQAEKLSNEFLADHPGEAPNHDPELDAGAPVDLWMFPTKALVEFLKSKGFEGTSVGKDHFVFDKKHLALVR